MILEALNRCYDALQRENKVPRRGWMMDKVSMALRLDDDGKLVGIIPLTEKGRRGKKEVMLPRLMSVPEFAPRSGTNPKARYLCDNAKFFLGIDEDSSAEKNEKYFQSAAKRHETELAHCKSTAAMAIRRFFAGWKPSEAKQNALIREYWEDILSAYNFVFWTGDGFAHEDSEIVAAWNKSVAGSGEVTGRCLVTGEESPIARIHSKIHGVRGTPSMGASLVGFNAAAFESYGKDGQQGLNAPISEQAAFAYTTALNYLLNDADHCKVIGDMTVVYWAEQQNAACQDIFGGFCFDEQNEITDQDLKAVWEAVKEGRTIVYNGQEIPYDNEFYVLGLSPNAARISVRLFYRSSFGEILSRLQVHQENMEIIRPGQKKWKPIPLWRLLLSTVSPKSKNQAASPTMAGTVFRAVLTGSPYPASLYQNVMVRIKAEQDDTDSRPPRYKITDARMAVIKAYLIKNKGRQITVALNENSTDTAYILGRIFSVWEQIQEAANPNLNSTIKDRYFNAACATPTAVFSKLQVLANHHLRKLEKGREVYFEKILTEIMGKLEGGEALPKTLSLDEQGMFILGYYHQTQKRYEKKEDKENG